MKSEISWNVLYFVVIFLNNINRSESFTCGKQPKNVESRLLQSLFCNYDKEVRPITNPKNVTIVKLIMYLKSFRYSDYSNSITLNSWLGMSWYDDHLKWDKSQFDNIDTIRVHADNLWKPDLAVYHTHSTQFEESCSASHCEVQNDGVVLCIPPCSHSGFCDGNYLDWPYDTQKCSFNLGTWMHKGSEIRFVSEKIILSKEGRQNNAWKLSSLNVTNLKGNYSCCSNDTFPSVKYTVVIHRFADSHEVVIVAPALIFVVISLVLLWLSPICAERMSMAASLIIWQVMILQDFSWVAPKDGSNTPKVLTFLRDSLLISAFLLLDTVAKRGLVACSFDPPSWIKTTTKALRENNVGKVVLTNPYLISNVRNIPRDTDSLITEAAPSGSEGETSAEAFSKEDCRRIWFTLVRILDTVTFLVLTVIYLIMIFNWIPTSRTLSEDAVTGVVSEDE